MEVSFSKCDFDALPATFPSALEYFTDSTNTINVKADVVLVVGKDRFYCHRLLLSLVSPVFTRMFDGEFKEHHDREIKLEGKTSESILELLKYIYPQFHGQVTKENVEGFLLLSDEYMIEHLKDACKHVMIQQLQAFKFASLPTQEKLEQPSLKLHHFHASDPALDLSQHHDSDPSIHQHINRAYPSRRPVTSGRHTATKSVSSYLRGGDKTASTSHSHPRYILFLDRARMPSFYDACNASIPVTSADVELWLRRLRILYKIDKGRNYSEVIDRILSILQFVPATLLYTLAHVTTDTYLTDEIMLNDIARARMFLLEEWASDGHAYRPIRLTDSYRNMAVGLLTPRVEPSAPSPSKILDEGRSSLRDIMLTASQSAVPTVPYDLNFTDSD